jgi:hypothetical protein
MNNRSKMIVIAGLSAISLMPSFGAFGSYEKPLRKFKNSTYKNKRYGGGNSKKRKKFAGKFN